MVEQLLPKNKIYLDEEVKLEHPTVKLDETDGSLLNIGQRKLRPTCYYCGDYNASYSKRPPPPTFGQKIIFVQKMLAHSRCDNFYCNPCISYSLHLKGFHCTCSERELTLEESKTMEHLYSRNISIKFECRWDGCKKIFGGLNLKQHEISCEAQPKTECPVAGCQWSGRIDRILDHFKDHENSEIKLGNLVLTMQSGKDYYLWILRQFVLVGYEVEELGEVFEHNIKLEFCKEVLEGVKPVGLVSVKGMLLKKIEGDDAVKTIRENVDLLVYFEAGKESDIPLSDEPVS